MKRKSVSAILTGILVILASSAASAQGVGSESNDLNSRIRSNTAIKDGINADNSARNKLNHANSAATADQQSHSKKDVEITQQIRRELMEDKDLSTYSKNIKVVTSRGKVVVTGPVRTSEERTAIEEIAKNVAGDENVQNQISITR